MVDQLTLQTIGILLTGLTVSIAAIYYTLTLRYTRRNQELTLKAQEQALETRQAQLFMPIYSKFYDKEFMKDFTDIIAIWEWDDFDDFWQKYGAFENPEAYSSIIACMDYFEGIGVLVKRNLIDASLIDDLISGLIMMYWEKTESYVREYRARRNYPQFAEYFEYLYYEIKAIVEEQHPELRT